MPEGMWYNWYMVQFSSGIAFPADGIKHVFQCCASRDFCVSLETWEVLFFFVVIDCQEVPSVILSSRRMEQNGHRVWFLVVDEC